MRYYHRLSVVYVDIVMDVYPTQSRLLKVKKQINAFQVVSL